jgi:cell division cycle 20-like protein 1 (cofactor of APC complex)
MNRDTNFKIKFNQGVTFTKRKASSIHNSPFLYRKDYKCNSEVSDFKLSSKFNDNFNLDSNDNLNHSVDQSGLSVKSYSPNVNTLVKKKYSDRFIPVSETRMFEKFEVSKTANNDKNIGDWNLSNNNSPNISNSPNAVGKDYNSLLMENFFLNEPNNILEGLNATSYNDDFRNNVKGKSKFFKFNTDLTNNKKPNSILHSIANYTYSNENAYNPINEIENEIIDRKISTKPYKTIEAPGLLDDFYLNLVDWSSSNLIAVGQSECVNLYCTNKMTVTKLFTYSGDKYVSSVIWNTK